MGLFFRLLSLLAHHLPLHTNPFHFELLLRSSRLSNRPTNDDSRIISRVLNMSIVYLMGFLSCGLLVDCTPSPGGYCSTRRRRIDDDDVTWPSQAQWDQPKTRDETNLFLSIIFFRRILWSPSSSSHPVLVPFNSKTCFAVGVSFCFLST